MKRHLRDAYALLRAAVADPREWLRVANRIPSFMRGTHFARSYIEGGEETSDVGSLPENPIARYFREHKEGNGIHKWEHYFDIYHRHLQRHVGRDVRVVEIGIQSGGSLEMYHSYFGDRCHVYGVDVQPKCKSYENDHVSVFIGDQADRGFWSGFKKHVSGIDILIDDGGHTPEQQRITLEEMLPFIRPGGVYICEDIHGCFNDFTAYAVGLADTMNEANFAPGHCLESRATMFQKMIKSIHFYPYVVVIEKNEVPVATLRTQRHGSAWQASGEG